MPYGNLLADVVQGSVANTPPAFRDGNGTQVGTLCRAWVNFNGTGTVAIRASFNVSSITDNGSGNYTVNFTNAMPDANYNVSGAVNFTANANNAAIALMPLVYNAGSIQVNTCTNGGQIDSLFINVAIFR